jgi:hypothetical protein
VTRHSRDLFKLEFQHSTCLLSLLLPPVKKSPDYAVTGFFLGGWWPVRSLVGRQTGGELVTEEAPTPQGC